MIATLSQLGIDRMTIAERIALVQEILDSVAADQRDEPVMSDRRRQELERRVAYFEANPDDGVPWEEVKAAALARFSQ